MHDADVIDRLVDEWAKVRPDLDPSPLALVGRVIVLARHLEASVETALKPHNLSLGQFDILATLRRHDETGLNPKQLCENVALSSGGMTSRLDRLEAAGWIRRQADPQDRRGVVVVLTERGRELIDAATQTRFQEATQSLPVLSSREHLTLVDLLRKWLLKFEHKSEFDS